MPNILVIRERQTSEPTLVTQAIDYHPRYYRFVSGNLKDVKVVIVKMIDSFRPPGLLQTLPDRSIQPGIPTDNTRKTCRQTDNVR